MDIQNELEALFEAEDLQALRYWLDSYSGRAPKERRTLARLSLYTLIVLASYDRSESRPIVWTLPRLLDHVRGYAKSQREDLDHETSLIDSAARQVILELSERKLLFPVASETGRLTLDDLDGATFIVKTWGSVEIQNYGQFLEAVCDAEPLDTHRE